MDHNETLNNSDNDWENRRLCSDENCIGVIGADGSCKECGQKFQGTETAADYPVERELEEESQVSANAPVLDDSEIDDGWENRRLCSDGNCIGTIGPDGNCRECGKPYI